MHLPSCGQLRPECECIWTISSQDNETRLSAHARLSYGWFQVGKLTRKHLLNTMVCTWWVSNNDTHRRLLTSYIEPYTIAVKRLIYRNMRLEIWCSKMDWLGSTQSINHLTSNPAHYGCQAAMSWRQDEYIHVIWNNYDTDCVCFCLLTHRILWTLQISIRLQHAYQLSLDYPVGYEV